MRIERESWNRNTPPFTLDDYESENSVNPAVSFGGVVMAVSLYGTAFWGLTQILYKQEAINWHLEPWQGYVFSAAYLILRALNRVMFPKT